MPTYDYGCEANGRVVEVKHPMSATIQTWGELCQLAGLEPGTTDTLSPVRRLATGGNVLKSGSSAMNSGHACSSGPCCGGGGCGLMD